MSKTSKYQEELDVIAFNQEQLDSLQIEVNELDERVMKSQNDLKEFNKNQNVQWEIITDSKPLDLFINKKQSWSQIVNVARANQASQSKYSDFLTDNEIINCITTVQELRKEANEDYSSRMIYELKDNFLHSLIGPFGLSPQLLRAFDGGAIPTVHNANKGIISNDHDEIKMSDYKNEYLRKDYAPQHEMNKERKVRLQDSEPIIDGYTNKTLDRDGRSHIEHVVSASELHDDKWARLFLNPEKRKELVNSEENKIWTSGSLNQSKSDRDLIDWMNTPSKKDLTKTNAQYFEIDTKKANEVYEKAQIKKKQVVYKAVGKELMVQCGKTSVSMGLRKALGYILYELAKEVFIETKEVLDKKKIQAINLKEEFTSRLKNVVKTITAKWKEIIMQFLDGAIAGFFSELIVFIINSFITTLKRTVRIIKEGFISLIELIRFVLNPPKDLSREEIHQQSLKMGTTIFIVSGGILFEEVIERFLQSNVLTAPLATFLAPILTGLMTGLTVAVVMYSIDKLDLFSAKEKTIDQQVTQKIMDELWIMEAELDL